MSPPEVEPLVYRKYEIKRRLGKGVSAWRGLVWGSRAGLGEPGWSRELGGPVRARGARVEFRAP